ncbi:HAD superfamily hydrolase (TIGR01509 family) [Arthrobacter sp. PvP023]|nr:HAD superfamily hydrolase (TIGR01509 family) [Arthrobacter sp. PvP023]
MDGTLVDTEPFWMAAQHGLALKHGVNWTNADARSTVGQAMDVSAALLQDRGVDLSVDEIIDSLLNRVVERLENGIPWLPGAQRILAELAAAQIPCALVTMAHSPVATRVASATPVGVFHTIVAGDNVSRGKPHPAPYLAAAELLGVEAANCVAVEDSVSGTASARSAGMQVIVVPGPTQPPAAAGLHFIPSLEAVSVDMFRNVLRMPTNH